MSDRAAIVQGDRTILLEVDHPAYEHARDRIAPFTELVRAPEHMHTYRLSALSLWNAAAAGVTADTIEDALRETSRFEVPSHVMTEIRDLVARYGVCTLRDHPADPTRMLLRVSSPLVRERLSRDKKLVDLVSPFHDGFLIAAEHRGEIKRALLGIGYPVTDVAAMTDGATCPIALREDVFTPHDYQIAAAGAFARAGSHGVIVLPCGAGKTVVAMLAMAALGTRTLVITTSHDACTQFRRELLAKTSLTTDEVAIFGAKSKGVAPVTLTTYAMLSKRGGSGPTGHVHFDRLSDERFGLVIYDEVHLLPAPVFRLTAELQARRRLGLTATLVREDGRAGDVFALVGPKRFEVPWRDLEKSGHIATATCFELRVPLPATLHVPYAAADARDQPAIAGDNPEKLRVLRALAERHAGDRVLVLGTYLEGLHAAARVLDAPVVTGETPSAEREKRYAAFRSGEIRTLVLSKVGNSAIDLPEANVLVQLSGSMGSRQEEAQRLGRVLRPKPGGATFYSLVTRDTIEQEHALHRQMFLVEQGYRYFVEDVEGTGDGAHTH